ncbi:MAG: hypothetical protein J2P25_23905, partial [Nocardiopsaceae bacterium]|nr:hypothetical protein [Nocardiopsaceae bacterium]
VALGESRTGALLGATFGAAAHPGTPLGSDVVRHLNETTVLLAGEWFPVGALWHDALARGAQLVWRTRIPGLLPVTDVLSDGTCLVRLPETWGASGHDAVVRMIEYGYRTASGHPDSRTFALLTTLTDPAEAPADEIVSCYESRWRGSSIAHCMAAGQQAPQMALRSRSPDMIRQEIWAMLCVYQRARGLMWHATHALRLHDGPPAIPRLTRVLRHSRAEALATTPAPVTSRVRV